MLAGSGMMLLDHAYSPQQLPTVQPQRDLAIQWEHQGMVIVLSTALLHTMLQ